MSRFTAESAPVVIGRRAVVRPDGDGIRRVAADSRDPAALVAACRELCAPSKRPDLVLADCLLRYFTVTPPQGLSSLEELRAAAQLGFEENFGAPAGWQIDAAWHAGQPFLAVAAPIVLLEALAALRPRSIAPAFVRVHDSLGSANVERWLVLRTPQWVTAARFHGAACRHVRSVALAADEPLAAWLDGEALLAGLPLDAVTLMTANAQPLEVGGAQVDAPADRSGLLGVLSAVDTLEEVAA